MKPIAPLESKLVAGQPARLMPPLKNGKAEERATSCLLATFRVVPGFAQAALKAAGAPSGKRFRANCYTEVVFEGEEEASSRIDGLIVATNGVTTWSALVESKVGAATLETEQVERYLAIAKKYKIDALITISNQYAPNPTHLPYSVAKAKLKSVGAFHFSWHSLLAKAVLVANDREMDDPEQSFILDDLNNFFQHPNSGISAFTAMHASWKNLCESVLAEKPIAKTDSETRHVVDSWLQLLRSISIDLSRILHRPADIYLTPSQKKAPDLLATDITKNLVEQHVIKGEFDIPHAAGRLTLTADLRRRKITASMQVQAPKDVTRTTASINWLTRQLKGIEVADVAIVAHWPGRTAKTREPLVELLKKPELLIPNGVKDLPKSFEIVLAKDLAGKFKGTQNLVSESNNLLIRFYTCVAQNITAWIPKPPKAVAQPPEPPTVEPVEAYTDDTSIEVPISSPPLLLE